MLPSNIFLFTVAYISFMIVLTVGEDSGNQIDRPHIIFMLGDDVVSCSFNVFCWYICLHEF